MRVSSFLLFIFFFSISTCLYAQEGIVSGTITDNEGLPLPGVSVIVQGTTSGIQTDFDGNYSIYCRVGDVLVYSYIGQKTRKVKVTSQMFNDGPVVSIQRKEPVKPIKNEAYTKLVEKRKSYSRIIPDVSDSPYTYSVPGNYLNVNRIKKIDSTKKEYRITYYEDDLFFEVGYDSDFGLQFVRERNLPAIQNTFVQGRPLNGTPTFQGPDTGEIFSFGPAISTQEFDGSNFEFDQNGRLVNIGLGNGIPAIPYANSIFQEAIKVFNKASFKIFNDRKSIEVLFTNNTRKDIFNVDQFRANELKAKASYTSNDGDHKLKAGIQFLDENNGQPNLNGFYSNLILSSLATPVSFENSQGFLLEGGGQRSFSPQNFNNPLWLFNQNQNVIDRNSFTGNLEYKTRLFDEIDVLNAISFNNSNEDQGFALPVGTVGFETGFLTQKQIDESFLNAQIALDYTINLDLWNIEFHTHTNFEHTALRYRFNEQTGFSSGFLNPNTLNNRIENKSNNTFSLSNKVKFSYENDVEVYAVLQNNSFFSSIQNNKAFLPSFQLSGNLTGLINPYGDWLNDLKIDFGYSRDVKESPLFYNNYSHNSLLISPENSAQFTANNDLFINESIALEESDNIDIGIQTVLAGRRLTLGFNYYFSKNQGGVFPVLENNAFELRNIVNSRRRGLEASIGIDINKWNSDFSFSSKLIFSKFRAEVDDILNNAERIPISGFSTISNNLIEGESAGILVGTAFLRDSQNRIIIGDDGFPLVDPTPRILGDPIPDFNLSFSNTFKFNRFSFGFLIDIQVGGDVWNGTQNVLNFLGRSQESANLRSTTNFLFEGVTTSGSLNTQTVAFADPNVSVFENRWVRYGFEGVGEEAIEDGSYINLREVSFSYELKHKRKRFFKDARFGIYALNLLTYSRFRGATPYSTLFDHTSAIGINFFNTPLISEIGFKINVKI